MRVDRLPAIYPPRPRGAIHPSTVDRYRGYLAQYKFDDIRLLISLAADGAIEVLSRKRQPVRSFAVDAALAEQFRPLRPRAGTKTLLDGGVLRTAYGHPPRKPVLLWDILVHEDEYLLGTTYAERYARLDRLCGKPRRLERRTGNATAYAIGPDLWLARNFDSGFSERFAAAGSLDAVEGLMLKNPAGRLEWGAREENNGDWQIRVRKASARHLI